MSETRPSILAEVRAWMVVSVAILVHTVGISWWGATITAEVRSLKEYAAISSGAYRDLEMRTRELEKQQALLGQRLWEKPQNPKTN